VAFWWVLKEVFMLYSSSDGCLWILNGVLSSDADNLIISAMMKAEWRWIFSLHRLLELGSK